METFCIGYERVPTRFSWRTSEHGDETADRVEYPSENNYDPGTVPHERINGLLGCEQAEVLQQNGRLDQKNCGAVDNLNDVEQLSKNEPMIREHDDRGVVHRAFG